MSEVINEQDKTDATHHGGEHNGHSHASTLFYTGVAIALAIVTYIEWAMLDWDLGKWTKPGLIILSVGKFAAVVAYFMHLKFDAEIFKRTFLGVLGLAVVIVFVVMAALGSLPDDNPETGRLHASIRNCQDHSDCGPTQRCRPIPAPKTAAALRKAKGLGERPVFSKCVEVPKDVRDAEGKDKPAREGGEIYAAVCVACHQKDGGGMLGPTVLGANLASAELWAQGDGALRNSIVNGKQGKIGVMPAQAGILSSEEIDNVLAYIKTTYAPK
ncbi:MAG: c-type cytochrome [Myxococcota bacterium]|nr:c-type cytochrome [Myxococcota bacterium]